MLLGYFMYGIFLTFYASKPSSFDSLGAPWKACEPPFTAAKLEFWQYFVSQCVVFYSNVKHAEVYCALIEGHD